MKINRSKNSFGSLFFTVDLKEVLDIFSETLDRCSIEYEIENDSISVKNIYLLEFMEKIFSTGFLSDMVTKSIRVLFLEEGEEISFSKIANATTLIKYKRELESTQMYTMFEEDLFEIHFQPIIDAKDGSIYGYESLIRGVDEDGKLVPPYKIFKFARDNDLTFFLDRRARELAIINASNQNIDKKLFINFIPTAIYEPEHCLQTTLKIANELGFDASNIVFEVVETEKIDDVTHLKKIIDYYKTNGFLTALDDVGSGYSSLNLLISLKPDIIKIDRDIIDKIDSDPLKQSVFKALINTSKDVGIKVLAEGIEREEEYHFVKNNGADLMQGFYFAQPSSIPPRDLTP